MKWAFDRKQKHAILTAVIHAWEDHMKKPRSSKARKMSCTCWLKGTKHAETRNPSHDEKCRMFISSRMLGIMARSVLAAQKYKNDPRRDALTKLARKHLGLKREGKKWVIYYHGRGMISGLVPDFMPLPLPSSRKLDPEGIYAQIRGALVSFALDVLDHPQFKKRRARAR